MKKLILSTLLTGLIAACGSSKHDGQGVASDQEVAIINGLPVKPAEVYALQTVRLFDLDPNGSYYPGCTATILAEDLILTAAHCLKKFMDVPPTVLFVAFGAQSTDHRTQDNPKTSIDIKKAFRAIQVEGFHIHKKYALQGQDMAVIKIKSKIPPGFQPVQLLPQELMSADHTKTKFENHKMTVVLAGFGITDEVNGINSKVLRKTVVSAVFSGKRVITDQTKGTGACNGDSGGPAFILLNKEIFLVGVTHGPAPGSTNCHQQGLFWNPSLERAFLNESAQKLGSKARF